MFHVKQFLLFLFLAISVQSYTQGNILLENHVFQLQQARDKSIDDLLSFDSVYNEQNSFEKDFFYWTNVMRKNPKEFSNVILIPFLAQFPSANSISSLSLLEDLSKLDTLPALLPDEHLIYIAKTHSYDLTQNQKRLSHHSSNGKDFAARMREAGILTCAGENLLMGQQTPLVSLILLLVDHNVPGYGHRKALLNPLYYRMGCSNTQVAHSTQSILVQLFSCK